MAKWVKKVVEAIIYHQIESEELEPYAWDDPYCYAMRDIHDEMIAEIKKMILPIEVQRENNVYYVLKPNNVPWMIYDANAKEWQNYNTKTEEVTAWPRIVWPV